MSVMDPGDASSDDAEALLVPAAHDAELGQRTDERPRAWPRKWRLTALVAATVALCGGAAVGWRSRASRVQAATSSKAFVGLYDAQHPPAQITIDFYGAVWYAWAGTYTRISIEDGRAVYTRNQDLKCALACSYFIRYTSTKEEHCMDSGAPPTRGPRWYLGDNAELWWGSTIGSRPSCRSYMYLETSNSSMAMGPPEHATWYFAERGGSPMNYERREVTIFGDQGGQQAPPATTTRPSNPATPMPRRYLALAPKWVVVNTMTADHEKIAVRLGTVDSNDQEVTKSVKSMQGSEADWSSTTEGKVGFSVDIPSTSAEAQAEAKIAATAGYKSTQGSESDLAKATRVSLQSSKQQSIELDFDFKKDQSCIWQFVRPFVTDTDVYLVKTQNLARTRDKNTPPRCMPGCAADLDPKAGGSQYQQCVPNCK